MDSNSRDKIMRRLQVQSCSAPNKSSSQARTLYLSGKYCRSCLGLLPPPHTPGLHHCSLCRPGSGRHTVYVSFCRYPHGWQCRFLEWNLITPAGKSVTFRDPDSLIEMARRGGGLPYAHSLQCIADGIKAGRGYFYLRLTDEQYNKLQGYRQFDVVRVEGV